MKKLSLQEERAFKIAGLSSSEQLVYVYLLEYGDQNPTLLAKATKTLRPNMYALLKTLVQKGFVQQIRKGKRFVYRAKEPEALLEIFSEQKKQFQSIIPTLELLRYQEQHKPSVRLFEGLEQIKSIYEESLDTEKVYGIASTDKLFDLDRAFFKNYVKSLRIKGIFFKDILSFGSGEQSALEMKDEMKAYYEYKLLSEKRGEFSNDILIYGDTVALISFATHIHAVTIKDAEMAKTFKAIFDTMWASL